MHTHPSRLLAVVAGAAVVVGAANLGAYAANGHPLLLGHRNDETRTSTVVNHGPGAGLSVVTRDDTPPFAVSSPAKVRRLNADRVDGIDGGQAVAYTYSLPEAFNTSSFTMTFPDLPRAHTYVASYWLQADMTVGSDGIVCELDATKLTGDPGDDDLAISASRHDFLATAAATAYVSTHNHSISLTCQTDSENKTIDSVFFGQVTFVPVGRTHAHQAVLVP